MQDQTILYQTKLGGSHGSGGEVDGCVIQGALSFNPLAYADVRFSSQHVLQSFPDAAHSLHVERSDWRPSSNIWGDPFDRPY
jgi:hypothetical protein